VAGVLVAPVAPDTAHLESLRAGGTPVVAITRCWGGGDYVTFDDRAGGRLAAEHLLRLGHRRLGFLAMGEEGNTAVQARLSGFLGGLQDAGAACAPAWRLYATHQTSEDGVRAADAFAELPVKPTAMFVTADRLAIGFAHRLQEHGLRVPADVAVVGYDDIEYNEYLEVPLTTVALPRQELGRLAAELLCGRIEDGEAHSELHQIQLAPRLVVRASCGSRAGTAGQSVGA